MDGIVSWVKNYSMVFLFFTVLTSLSAKKEYKRYLQIFVEIVLVITLMMPLLKLMGKETDFFDKIAYDTFWQELDSIKADKEKLDFLGEEKYVEHYEKVIEADVGGMANEAGYEVVYADVTLNSKFEIVSVNLSLAKMQEYTVIQGSIEEMPEDEEITKLKEKISDFYQVDAEKIRIDT